MNKRVFSFFLIVSLCVTNIPCLPAAGSFLAPPSAEHIEAAFNGNQIQNLPIKTRFKRWIRILEELQLFLLQWKEEEGSVTFEQLAGMCKGDNFPDGKPDAEEVEKTLCAAVSSHKKYRAVVSFTDIEVIADEQPKEETAADGTDTQSRKPSGWKGLMAAAGRFVSSGRKHVDEIPMPQAIPTLKGITFTSQERIEHAVRRNITRWEKELDTGTYVRWFGVALPGEKPDDNQDDESDDKTPQDHDSNIVELSAKDIKVLQAVVDEIIADKYGFQGHVGINHIFVKIGYIVSEDHIRDLFRKKISKAVPGINVGNADDSIEWDKHQEERILQALETIIEEKTVVIPEDEADTDEAAEDSTDSADDGLPDESLDDPDIEVGHTEPYTAPPAEEQTPLSPKEAAIRDGIVECMNDPGFDSGLHISIVLTKTRRDVTKSDVMSFCSKWLAGITNITCDGNAVEWDEDTLESDVETLRRFQLIAEDESVGLDPDKRRAIRNAMVLSMHFINGVNLSKVKRRCFADGIQVSMEDIKKVAMNINMASGSNLLFFNQIDGGEDIIWNLQTESGQPLVTRAHIDGTAEPTSSLDDGRRSDVLPTADPADAIDAVSPAGTSELTNDEFVVLQGLIRFLPTVNPNEWMDYADFAVFCKFPDITKTLQDDTVIGPAIEKILQIIGIDPYDYDVLSDEFSIHISNDDIKQKVIDPLEALEKRESAFHQPADPSAAEHADVTDVVSPSGTSELTDDEFAVLQGLIRFLPDPDNEAETWMSISTFALFCEDKKITNTYLYNWVIADAMKKVLQLSGVDPSNYSITSNEFIFYVSEDRISQVVINPLKTLEKRESAARQPADPAAVEITFDELLTPEEIPIIKGLIQFIRERINNAPGWNAYRYFAEYCHSEGFTEVVPYNVTVRVAIDHACTAISLKSYQIETGEGDFCVGITGEDCNNEILKPLEALVKQSEAPAEKKKKSPGIGLNEKEKAIVNVFIGILKNSPKVKFGYINVNDIRYHQTVDTELDVVKDTFNKIFQAFPKLTTTLGLTYIDNGPGFHEIYWPDEYDNPEKEKVTKIIEILEKDVLGIGGDEADAITHEQKIAIITALRDIIGGYQAPDGQIAAYAMIAEFNLDVTKEQIGECINQACRLEPLLTDYKLSYEEGIIRWPGTFDANQQGRRGRILAFLGQVQKKLGHLRSRQESTRSESPQLTGRDLGVRPDLDSRGQVLDEQKITPLQKRIVSEVYYAMQRKERGIYYIDISLIQQKVALSGQPTLREIEDVFYRIKKGYPELVELKFHTRGFIGWGCYPPKGQNVHTARILDILLAVEQNGFPAPKAEFVDIEPGSDLIYPILREAADSPEPMVFFQLKAIGIAGDVKDNVEGILVRCIVKDQHGKVHSLTGTLPLRNNFGPDRQTEFVEKLRRDLISTNKKVEAYFVSYDENSGTLVFSLDITATPQHIAQPPSTGTSL